MKQSTNHPKQLKEFIIPIGQKITDLYWSKLFQYLKDNPKLITTFPGFLLAHFSLVFYFGKTHLAIEYNGPENIDSLDFDKRVQLKFHDYTQTDNNFFEQIIGFEYDNSSKIEFPIPNYLVNLVLPTNKGFDKLQDLNWNFAAQDSMLGINAGKFTLLKGEFTRIINAFFFDADETGLKTRHIKWIDFIPLDYDDSHEDSDELAINFNVFSDELVVHDANFKYPMPDNHDFVYSKLPKINRFIELIGNDQTTEPQITSFISSDKYQFILSMAFLAKEIFPQINCEWQNVQKKSIQPDFFVLKANGYADIVEFKLPKLKSSSTVGRENRETFSAEINSYISQTRTYKEYFNDSQNRKWFEAKYGFKVLKPRRILVVGRRNDFDNDEWKEIIADYNDVEIVNYDELIDGVTAQFYR